MDLKDLLSDLLIDFASIQERHGEVSDTEVEEATGNAIFDGFLKPIQAFSLPESFGMYSPEGNALVRAALDRYISRAAPTAAKQKLTFHQRLAAFQDRECTVGAAQVGFNDFFRYVHPQRFDLRGNVK